MVACRPEAESHRQSPAILRVVSQPALINLLIKQLSSARGARAHAHTHTHTHSRTRTCKQPPLPPDGDKSSYTDCKGRQRGEFTRVSAANDVSHAYREPFSLDGMFYCVQRRPFKPLHIGYLRMNKHDRRFEPRHTWWRRRRLGREKKSPSQRGLNYSPLASSVGPCPDYYITDVGFQTPVYLDTYFYAFEAQKKREDPGENGTCIKFPVAAMRMLRTGGWDMRRSQFTLELLKVDPSNRYTQCDENTCTQRRFKASRSAATANLMSVAVSPLSLPHSRVQLLYWAAIGYSRVPKPACTVRALPHVHFHARANAFRACTCSCVDLFPQTGLDGEILASPSRLFVASSAQHRARHPIGKTILHFVRHVPAVCGSSARGPTAVFQIFTFRTRNVGHNTLHARNKRKFTNRIAFPDRRKVESNLRPQQQEDDNYEPTAALHRNASTKKHQKSARTDDLSASITGELPWLRSSIITQTIPSPPSLLQPIDCTSGASLPLSTNNIYEEQPASTTLHTPHSVCPAQRTNTVGADHEPLTGQEAPDTLKMPRPPPPTTRIGFNSRRGRFPDFRTWVIVPDDAAGRRVFSGISRFRHSCILASLHTHLVLQPSAFKITIVLQAPSRTVGFTRRFHTLSSIQATNSSPAVVPQSPVVVHISLSSRKLSQTASIKDSRPLGCSSIYSVLGRHLETSPTRVMRRGGLRCQPVSPESLSSSLNVSETLASERRSVTPASLAAVSIRGFLRRGEGVRGPGSIVPSRGEGEVGLRLRRGAAESATVAARNSAPSLSLFVRNRLCRMWTSVQCQSVDVCTTLGFSSQ
ncbi:hypothetical protein PR048_014858 [Dryococelus australis]|uniref:Uncharacterized protein n=1 Tax=Dryococelus australis TaxID=614101 RepID=A0ABQ9HFB6_9NEOP|nr:hypothetical protein PR048_014858 [Dryococelus australis]